MTGNRLTPEQRIAALEVVLNRYLPGYPPNLQEVGRGLGFKSKSSIYENCWRKPIERAITGGRIQKPTTSIPWNKGRGRGASTYTVHQRHGVSPTRKVFP